MRRHRHRAVGAALAGVLALVVLPACDPPPPRPVFVVTTFADGLDRAVGDGVCEVTEGVGDCSVRAALAEVDAVGAGDVTVRRGTYQLTVADPGDDDADLDVSGDVRINWEQRQGGTLERRDDRVLDVHAGGRVTAHGISLGNATNDVGAVVRVAGTLMLGESSIGQGLERPSTSTDAALEVAAGGNVFLSNSAVSGTVGTAAVVNRGVVQARFSSFSGLSIPGIHTEPGATTTIGASYVAQLVFQPSTPEDTVRPACSGGMPVSLGYNRVPNVSCGVTGPGDTQVPKTPIVDRVPVGVLGCGEAYVFDGAGRVRPQDDDFDGTPACDLGPSEYGTRITPKFGQLPSSATVGSCYYGTFFGDGAPLPHTWTVTGLPPGLTFEQTNRVIRGIPEVAGSFEVTFTASAPRGGGSGTTTIVVAPSSLPPMVSC